MRSPIVEQIMNGLYVTEAGAKRNLAQLSVQLPMPLARSLARWCQQSGCKAEVAIWASLSSLVDGSDGLCIQLLSSYLENVSEDVADIVKARERGTVTAEYAEQVMKRLQEDFPKEIEERMRGVSERVAAVLGVPAPSSCSRE